MKLNLSVDSKPLRLIAMGVLGLLTVLAILLIVSDLQGWI